MVKGKYKMKEEELKKQALDEIIKMLKIRRAPEQDGINAEKIKGRYNTLNQYNEQLTRI